MKHQTHFSTIANQPVALRVNTLAGLLALMILLIIGQSASAQSKYVKKFRPLADSLSEVYKIPASVILGVALLESGSGTSRNCKLLHNHFGVVGKNNLLKTMGVKTRYKQYSDSLASYVDFCKIIAKKKFYKKLKDNMDHKVWVDSISKAGYSEVPEEWKQKVLDTIRKNKLSSIH
jgi:flagellum-specific peptidoglycan hydrolase FlgJ